MIERGGAWAPTLTAIHPYGGTRSLVPRARDEDPQESEIALSLDQAEHDDTRMLGCFYAKKFFINTSKA